METVLIGVLSFIAGGAAVAWIERRWAKSDVRETRRDTRGEEAATRIGDLLSQLQELCSDEYGSSFSTGDHPGRALAIRMQKEIVLIPDERVRAALRDLAEVLAAIEAVARFRKIGLHSVARELSKSGHAIIGAYVHDQPLPPTPTLDQYLDT